MKMENPRAERVRITVIPVMKGVELGIALVAFLAWLAVKEVAPLLIGVAVLVSGPAAPHVQRACHALFSRWAGSDVGRHAPRLIALICLAWAALA